MISTIKPSRGLFNFLNKQEKIIHLFAWPLYLGLMALPWFYGGVSSGLHSMVYYLLTVLVYLPGVFYLNTFYLIPQYLKKKQFFKYALILLGLGLGLAVFDAVIAFLLKADFNPSAIAYGFFSELVVKVQTAFAGLFLLTMFSFTYRFSVDWIVNIGLIETLKAEKYEMELAFLKSQVDPHFLFNTLNSLYALALEEKGDKTADGIAKLGTLMRYNLHDSRADFISVHKEVDYIKKYIELQQLRISPNNVINLQIDIPEKQGYSSRIAPMLLIPFVENAFKHGISPTDNTYVLIKMKLEGLVFSLTAQNSVIDQIKPVDVGGVGLKNVEGRLHLLYPDNHRLTSAIVENTYHLNLQINLS